MKRNSNIGTSHPLGAALKSGGANFSLFSRSASRVELLQTDDTTQPHRTAFTPDFREPSSIETTYQEIL
jgi:pullulanase/glycogen debranching enzyme